MAAEAEGGSVGGAIVAQIAEDLLFLAGVLAGESGEGVGDDIAVMQVGHGWIAAHVQP